MVSAVRSPLFSAPSSCLSLLLLCRLLLWNKSPFVWDHSVEPFSCLLAVQPVEFPGISCCQVEERKADPCSRVRSFHPIHMLMLPRTELFLGSRTAFLPLLEPSASNHRITEHAWLEGTYKDHCIQLLALHRAILKNHTTFLRLLSKLS